MFLCLLTGLSALKQKKNMFSISNGGRLFQLVKEGCS